jgi:CopG antitoxin of type II toxin-antitoxin system
MSNDKTPITKLAQIPANMSEQQAREFWSSHEITEEYVDEVGTVPAEDLPTFRPRTKPVSVRLDSDVIRRMKRLAKIKNTGWQTLFKQFAAERLYEEEKRAGILAENESAPSGLSKNLGRYGRNVMNELTTASRPKLGLTMVEGGLRKGEVVHPFRLFVRDSSKSGQAGRASHPIDESMPSLVGLRKVGVAAESLGELKAVRFQRHHDKR